MGPVQLPKQYWIFAALAVALVCVLTAWRGSAARVSSLSSEREVLASKLAESERRAEDLEKQSHVVTTRTVLPSGEVRESRTVDTRVSDRTTEAATVEQQVTEQRQATQKTEQQTAAAYSVTAWRAGLAVPQYGATVGARLGGLPLWLEAGWLVGSGPMLGVRGEF